MQYVDYVGSWGPAIVGHAHPEVTAALHEQIKKVAPGFMALDRCPASLALLMLLSIYLAQRHGTQQMPCLTCFADYAECASCPKGCTLASQYSTDALPCLLC